MQSVPYLLELFLGIRRLVLVWVILDGLLAVSFLEIDVVDVCRDTQLNETTFSRYHVRDN